MTKSLTIRKPDDWHLHLRDGAVLSAVLPYSTQHFARAIIMPNLVPPVVTVADAKAYYDRIVARLSPDSDFQPLMTLYMSEGTDPNDAERGFKEGFIKAIKLYPAGATTNSHGGVRDLTRVTPLLERMASIGMPMLVHGEVPDFEVDIFDREKVFIDTVLDPLRRRIPELKVVMEHVTTKDGVDYVKSAEKGLACTLTPHHLIINRNNILAGGIKPHYYCLPVAKREEHRLALRAAATSGDARFMLGTDSAPHLTELKECACGCAGIFNSVNTMSCLAHVFEEEGALDRLEGFTSLHGPAFHGMKPNEERITLVKEPIDYPVAIDSDEGPITVFDPLFKTDWRVLERAD